MLKVYELHWAEDQEICWIAAISNIEALQLYCQFNEIDIFDLSNLDYIIETPKEKLLELIVVNDEESYSMSFEAWLRTHNESAILKQTL